MPKSHIARRARQQEPTRHIDFLPAFHVHHLAITISFGNGVGWLGGVDSDADAVTQEA